jgi:hypothetical protein
MKRWEADKKIAKEAKQKIPEKPVEPTAENFSIGAIETRNTMSFGPEYVFSKAKDSDYYSYMMQVKPGTYVYHGPLFFNPQTGYTGTCYCMGSVQFEVKAGVITNLGNFLSAAPDASADIRVPTSATLVPNTMWGATKIEVRSGGGKADYAMPESLSKWQSVEADFRAAGKSDNHYGVMISRMPPVPGVLAYKRDKVIDLKAKAAEAPAGTQ